MGSCISIDCTTGEVGCGPGARIKRKERKRQVSEVLAAESKTAELLARVPGRMCVNGASSAACVFTQQGRKGRNQDAMVVWENFASRTDATFCGVFDGHGPYGHLVAKRVRDSLPSKLMSQWKARMRGDDMNAGSGLEEEDWKESASEGLDSKVPEMFRAWRYSFLKAYNVMDKELRMHPTIDCFCSGTTAVTMLLQGQDLVIGNVGDSRAVLGTRADDNTMEAVQLTVDLKPNLPKEAERIKTRRGRVFALHDEPQVARVWLPHDDSPGLAMARAFGDFCLKDFGLIAVPEVTYRRLTQRDQFIVLASDGVWDVLSNKEAVDVISAAPTRTTAARALVETAVRAWRLKYPTSKVDDCAVVCLYVSQDSGKSSCPLTTAAAAVTDVCVEKNAEEESPALDRSKTASNGGNEVRKSCNGVQERERSWPRRSLADCLSTTTSAGGEEDGWTALEGVTRVNSLVNLPRFDVKRRGGGGGG